MSSGRYPDTGGGSSTVPDPWYAARASEMLAVVPALTDFETFKLGQYGLGSTLATMATNSAGVEGGGITGAGSAAVLAFTGAITSHPKTGKWSVTFRAKLATPVTGHSNFMGLESSNGGIGVVFGSLFAVDATHWVIQIFNGSTTNVIGTIVADALFHNFMLSGDGTTISLYVDNVLAASTTTLTNLSDTGVQVCLANTTAGDTIVTKFLYGFVGP